MMDYNTNNRWSDFDSISTYSNEGLETYQQSPVKLRPKEQLTVPKSERINSYRFSMANLEETQESELDSILTELSLLEQKGDMRQSRTQGHSRSSSIVSGANSTISQSTATSTELRESSRTDSPDNDSAFSDTVSLLSSESSASSGLSSLNNINKVSQPNIVQDAKSTKIQLALQKLEHASVRRLFVKAFSDDGSSKSLLVDERMNCGFVTKLLADKNHVNMEVTWGLIEYLPELYIERLFEDHELLVENLLLWSNESKNRVLFIKRPDRVSLFNTPEKFLPSFEMAPGTLHDEDSRTLLLDEFFANNNQITLEGSLYLKSESKKGWKRFHFVLRPSGLYYFPEEKKKSKSSKDLLCLAMFNAHNIYKSVGWKKKYKAPTDFGFALKCPKVNITGKGMKMLCAEDFETLQKWIMCCRIAKYGKKLMDNYKTLVEDLAREDLDKLASSRLSFSSIGPQTRTDSLTVVNANQNGRLSRASTSSSSSGCLSDDNNGFESEFSTGTIKRKPTMKPNLPLTSKTRQLIKEVDDTSSRLDTDQISLASSLEQGGTLTRRRSHSSSSNGTLKRQGSNRCSIDTMKSSNHQPTPPPTPEETFKKIQPISPSIDEIDSPKFLPSCMTDSMLSLPPPPEPSVCTMSASSLSLNSLPFPEPPDEVILQQMSMSEISVESQSTDDRNSINSNQNFPAMQLNQVNGNLNYQINGIPETEPVYATKTILKAPPYKAPPSHNKYSLPPPIPQKSVTFADSPPPTILRKKVCFDDQVESILVSPRQERGPPMPPLRDRTTSLTCSSPKRLCDSICNPPQDFWADLQRVVNKKLGVAQKCKMNLQMSPGEVLGFRDAEPTSESHYYRETSTSNWVLEHYGDNLYENWDGNRVNGAVNQQNVVYRDINAIQKQNNSLSPQRRSARGPPVPVRNSSTRLSTNGNTSDMQ